MKITLKSIFRFGKHEGKSFVWVLLNDINYLRFLRRKGFDFDKISFWFITEPFEIDEEIVSVIKKDNLEFRLISRLICRAKKGRRKKDTIHNYETKVLSEISLIGVPFEIIERKIEKQHFDSKAFQNDDRFFTTESIIKTKKYNPEIINPMIERELKRLTPNHQTIKIK